MGIENTVKAPTVLTTFSITMLVVIGLLGSALARPQYLKCGDAKSLVNEKNAVPTLTSAMGTVTDGHVITELRFVKDDSPKEIKAFQNPYYANYDPGEEVSVNFNDDGSMKMFGLLISAGTFVEGGESTVSKISCNQGESYWATTNTNGGVFASTLNMPASGNVNMIALGAMRQGGGVKYHKIIFSQRTTSNDDAGDNKTLAPSFSPTIAPLAVPAPAPLPPAPAPAPAPSPPPPALSGGAIGAIAGSVGVVGIGAAAYFLRSSTATFEPML